MLFEGKVVVVTGAGSGIGQATAEQFARAGAAVVGVDIDGPRITSVIHDITTAGGRAIAVQADISQESEARRIASEAVQAFGGIDYLCNIAGIQTYGTVIDTDEETWNRTLDVNLKGAYLLSRYCIPEMIQRGGGAVVNVASVQGLTSQPRVAAYAASKGGVIAMTRTMALDHAEQNIRVNCVCPGPIETPLMHFAAHHFNSSIESDVLLTQWKQAVPLKRLGKPEEVAQTILFLASDAASFMTGSILVVDGGQIAKGL